MQKWWTLKAATGKKKMNVQLSIDCAEVLRDIYLSARQQGFLDCKDVVPAAGHNKHMRQMMKDLSLLGVFMQHMLQAVFTVGQTLEQNLMHMFIASQLLLVMIRETSSGFFTNHLYRSFQLNVEAICTLVARAARDFPESEFFFCTLGSQELEDLFGALRELFGGSQRSFDFMQGMNCLGRAVYLREVLAQHPTWERITHTRGGEHVGST